MFEQTRWSPLPRRAFARPSSWLALSFAVACEVSVALAAESVATFSIVGADPTTGELGVAVQSKFFSVGSVVPWARAGVGAIATQSFANTTFGPRGLDLLAAGTSPEEVIASLTTGDDGRDQRQIGIVDATGRAAAYTGTSCMAWAGHMSGPNYSGQGNILAGEPVVRAMAQAFEQTTGELGEKLMRAIEAGQGAGGDARGMQSAAILIVKAGAGYGGFNDRYCDLRVDDHRDPIAELRRIFDLWKWNALINDGYALCDRNEWTAAFLKGEALVAMKPGEGESYYHLACYYSKAAKREEALTTLEAATRRDPALGSRARLDPDFEPLRTNETFLSVTETRGAWTAAF
jgi:uncharacterized Ntn-hydrolase superfamily protein